MGVRDEECVPVCVRDPEGDHVLDLVPLAVSVTLSVTEIEGVDVLLRVTVDERVRVRVAVLDRVTVLLQVLDMVGDTDALPAAVPERVGVSVTELVFVPDDEPVGELVGAAVTDALVLSEPVGD